MDARIAVWTAITFLASLAIPAFSWADVEPSVDSPEAFQSVCEKAMPDLLQGKVPEILEKIASQKHIGGLSEQVRYGLKPYQAESGSPIDSRLVGVRRVGTMVRQYIYLCRYEHVAIFWCLTATESKGRWSLTSECFGNARRTAIFSHVPPDSPSKDAEYSQFADTIVSTIIHTPDPNVAADILTPSFLELKDVTKETIRRELYALITGIAIKGGAAKFESIESKNIGDALARRSYIVQCNRCCIAIDIQLYRPGKDWKVADVHYDIVKSDEEMLARAMLEPVSAATTAQTACKPDTEPAKSANPQRR